MVEGGRAQRQCQSRKPPLVGAGGGGWLQGKAV